MVLQLAWRNLWRHRKRSWITIAAISFTTLLLVFMLSFQLGVYDTMKTQNLRVLDGFAQIQHPDFLDKPSLKNSFEIHQAWSNQLGENDAIKAFGYRAQTYAILSNEEEQNAKNRGALIMGVEPDKEFLLSSIPNKITNGRYLDPQNLNEIVIGIGLAQQLDVRVGEKVQILGQDRNGSLAIDLLEVVGIIDTHFPMLDRQLAQMSLISFQTLFALPNQAQQIVLETFHLSQVDHLNKTIITPSATNKTKQQSLVLQNWRQLQPSLDQAIKLDFASAILWYAALLVIVILILINTLYMSILERQTEFSLLYALGVSQNKIAGIVILETLLTVIISLMIGLCLGIITTAIFIKTGIVIPGTEGIFEQFGLSGALYPSISLVSVGFAPGVLLMGLIIMCVVVWVKMRQLKPLSGRQL